MGNLSVYFCGERKSVFPTQGLFFLTYRARKLSPYGMLITRALLPIEA